MSRPAFSPPHTVGQFRCPIESTRHTHSSNRSPAAEACRASLPVRDADERLVDGMILLLLLLVTAASGLMSGDTCNFPLTELGLVDTCNLTTEVDAYQVPWQGYTHNSQRLGSTMEIQHWSQLSLARGSSKRCRQHGEFLLVKFFSNAKLFSCLEVLQWWICPSLRLLRLAKKRGVGWWQKSRYCPWLLSIYCCDKSCSQTPTSVLGRCLQLQYSMAGLNVEVWNEWSHESW